MKNFSFKADELIKLFVLCAIFFFICLNNHILRNLKETLVITNPELGINAIPFIKTWVVLPVVLLFVKGYIALSARFNQAKVTYMILSAILLYYIIFIFVLYPNEESFRLNLPGDWIAFKTHFYTFGEIIRHWSLSLYYCMSEIWGTIVMMILFWGTCNRSTNLEQAKRFYSPILFVSNLSGFVSAQLSLACSQGSMKYFFFPALANWKATLSTLTLFVSFATAIILGLFYVLNTYVIKGSDSRGSLQHDPLDNKSMSLIAILRYIASNMKFRPLAFMIFAYYFCCGIVELIMKHYIYTLYADSNDFNDVLNRMTIYISLASTFVTAFITGSLIRRFSWGISALITPILLLIPLSILLLNSFFQTDAAIALVVSTFVCGVYFMLSRICKFSFFDLSKEIACVEFSYEEQIKSKSVLDGVIPKFAKTIESLFLQLLLIIFTDFDLIIPMVLLVIFVMHLFWVSSIPVFKANLKEAHE